MIHIKTYLDYLMDIGFLDSYFSNAGFNQEECLVELTISTQTKKKLKYGVRQVFFKVYLIKTHLMIIKHYYAKE